MRKWRSCNCIAEHSVEALQSHRIQSLTLLSWIRCCPSEVVFLHGPGAGAACCIDEFVEVYLLPKRLDENMEKLYLPVRPF